MGPTGIEPVYVVLETVHWPLMLRTREREGLFSSRHKPGQYRTGIGAPCTGGMALQQVGHPESFIGGEGDARLLCAFLHLNKNRRGLARQAFARPANCPMASGGEVVVNHYLTL